MAISKDFLIRYGIDDLTLQSITDYLGKIRGTAISEDDVMDYIQSTRGWKYKQYTTHETQTMGIPEENLYNEAQWARLSPAARLQYINSIPVNRLERDQYGNLIPESRINRRFIHQTDARASSIFNINATYMLHGAEPYTYIPLDDPSKLAKRFLRGQGNPKISIEGLPETEGMLARGPAGIPERHAVANVAYVVGSPVTTPGVGLIDQKYRTGYFYSSRVVPGEVSSDLLGRTWQPGESRQYLPNTIGEVDRQASVTLADMAVRTGQNGEITTRIMERHSFPVEGAAKLTGGGTKAMLSYATGPITGTIGPKTAQMDIVAEMKNMTAALAEIFQQRWESRGPQYQAEIARRFFNTTPANMPGNIAEMGPGLIDWARANIDNLVGMVQYPLRVHESNLPRYANAMVGQPTPIENVPGMYEIAVKQPALMGVAAVSSLTREYSPTELLVSPELLNIVREGDPALARAIHRAGASGRTAQWEAIRAAMASYGREPLNAIDMSSPEAREAVTQALVQAQSGLPVRADDRQIARSFLKELRGVSVGDLSLRNSYMRFSAGGESVVLPGMRSLMHFTGETNVIGEEGTKFGMAAYRVIAGMSGGVTEEEMGKRIAAARQTLVSAAMGPESMKRARGDTIPIGDLVTGGPATGSDVLSINEVFDPRRPQGGVVYATRMPVQQGIAKFAPDFAFRAIPLEEAVQRFGYQPTGMVLNPLALGALAGDSDGDKVYFMRAFGLTPEQNENGEWGFRDEKGQFHTSRNEIAAAAAKLVGEGAEDVNAPIGTPDLGRAKSEILAKLVSEGKPLRQIADEFMHSEGLFQKIAGAYNFGSRIMAGMNVAAPGDTDAQNFARDIFRMGYGRAQRPQEQVPLMQDVMNSLNTTIKGWAKDINTGGPIQMGASGLPAAVNTAYRAGLAAVKGGLFTPEQFAAGYSTKKTRGTFEKAVKDILANPNLRSAQEQEMLMKAAGGISGQMQAPMIKILKGNLYEKEVQRAAEELDKQGISDPTERAAFINKRLTEIGINDPEASKLARWMTSTVKSTSTFRPNLEGITDPEERAKAQVDQYIQNIVGTGRAVGTVHLPDETLNTSANLPMEFPAYREQLQQAAAATNPPTAPSEEAQAAAAPPSGTQTATPPPTPPTPPGGTQTAAPAAPPPGGWQPNAGSPPGGYVPRPTKRFATMRDFSRLQRISSVVSEWNNGLRSEIIGAGPAPLDARSRKQLTLLRSYHKQGVEILHGLDWSRVAPSLSEEQQQAFNEATNIVSDLGADVNVLADWDATLSFGGEGLGRAGIQEVQAILAGEPNVPVTGIGPSVRPIRRMAEAMNTLAVRRQPDVTAAQQLRDKAISSSQKIFGLGKEETEESITQLKSMADESKTMISSIKKFTSAVDSVAPLLSGDMRRNAQNLVESMSREAMAHQQVVNAYGEAVGAVGGGGRAGRGGTGRGGFAGFLEGAGGWLRDRIGSANNLFGTGISWWMFSALSGGMQRYLGQGAQDLTSTTMASSQIQAALSGMTPEEYSNLLGGTTYGSMRSLQAKEQVNRLMLTESSYQGLGFDLESSLTNVQRTLLERDKQGKLLPDWFPILGGQKGILGAGARIESVASENILATLAGGMLLKNTFDWLGKTVAPKVAPPILGALGIGGGAALGIGAALTSVPVAYGIARNIAGEYGKPLATWNPIPGVEIPMPGIQISSSKQAGEAMMQDLFKGYGGLEGAPTPAPTPATTPSQPIPLGVAGAGAFANVFGAGGQGDFDRLNAVLRKAYEERGGAKYGTIEEFLTTGALYARGLRTAGKQLSYEQIADMTLKLGAAATMSGSDMRTWGDVLSQLYPTFGKGMEPEEFNKMFDKFAGTKLGEPDTMKQLLSLAQTMAIYVPMMPDKSKAGQMFVSTLNDIAKNPDVGVSMIRALWGAGPDVVQTFALGSMGMAEKAPLYVTGPNAGMSKLQVGQMALRQQEFAENVSYSNFQFSQRFAQAARNYNYDLGSFTGTADQRLALLQNGPVPGESLSSYASNVWSQFGSQGASYAQREQRRQWQKEDIAAEMQLGAIRKSFEDQIYALEKKLFEDRRKWQEEDFKIQERRLQESRQHQIVSRQWQQEDWALQQNVGAMQFGWQMEDIDEAIRYATGRQKVNLQKQRERAIVSRNIEQVQFEREKGRTVTQWGWQDTDYKYQLDQLKRQEAQAKEVYEVEKQIMELRKAMSDFEYAASQASLARQMARVDQEKIWDDEEMKRATVKYQQDYEAEMASLARDQEHAKKLQELEQAQIDLAIAEQKRAAEVVDYLFDYIISKLRNEESNPPPGGDDTDQKNKGWNDGHTNTGTTTTPTVPSGPVPRPKGTGEPQGLSVDSNGGGSNSADFTTKEGLRIKIQVDPTTKFNRYMTNQLFPK